MENTFIITRLHTEFTIDPPRKDNIVGVTIVQADNICGLYLNEDEIKDLVDYLQKCLNLLKERNEVQS